MLRGLGRRTPLYWVLGAPGLAIRAWRILATRVGAGAGTGPRSGSIGTGARIDPAAVVRDSVIGAHVRVAGGAVIEDSRLKDYSHVDRYCQVALSELGEYSYASHGVLLQRAEIGRFCSIAAYAAIGATRHPMDRVTTHPFTYLHAFGRLRRGDDALLLAELGAGRVMVGPDVWIGAHTIVLPGVRIGPGAVIGASSVVRRDVGPYEVVVGAPARMVRKRFDDATIERLLRSRWWEWNRESLRDRVAEFADVRAFAEKYGG